MRYLSFIILISLLSACNTPRKNNQQREEFYAEKGGFDFSRYPLIKPYEMVTVIPSDEWIVQSADSSGLPETIPGVRYVNVVDSIIFVYSKKTILNGQLANEGWFILVPKNSELRGFRTKKEYLTYLSSIGVKAPKMYKANEVFHYFDSRDTLDWKELNRSW